MAVVALVLIFGALVGFALGRTSMSDHPVRTVRPLSGTGSPGFLPASGWSTAQTDDAAPPQAGAAMAATVRLLDAPGSLPHETLAALGPDDVLIQVTIYGPADFLRGPTSARADRSFPLRTLPLRVEQGVLDSGFEGVPEYWRYAIPARVGGWWLEVDVWVGSGHPSAAVRRLADRELARLILPSTCPDADPISGAQLHGAAVIAGRMIPNRLDTSVTPPQDFRYPRLTVRRAIVGDPVPARCSEVPRNRIAVVDVHYPRLDARSPFKRRTLLVSRQHGRYVVWSRVR